MNVRIPSRRSSYVPWKQSSACFLWCISCEHSSSNHSSHCFLSNWPRNSLSEIFIFSLIFSQAVFMFLLSFNFSKAANLFEILIRYCSLTSTSRRFFRFNLVVCLPTVSPHIFLSPDSIQYQSAPLKDRTSSTLLCHLLSINMWSNRIKVFFDGQCLHF